MEYPIDPQSVKIVLFVCTGNVCRSPFAAGLLSKLMEPHRKIRVFSAGISASPGSVATLEAVQIAEGYGVVMTEHKASALSLVLLEQADLVFCMEESHRNLILNVRPEWAGKVVLLDTVRADHLEEDGQDIIDPYGLGLEIYQQVFKSVATRVSDLVKWLKSAPAE